MFTLPGFGITQEDGTVNFYISNEKGAYYVAKGNSNIEVGQVNVNGDIVKEPRPIVAEFLANYIVRGIRSNGNNGWSYSYEPSISNFGLPGRYTSIGVASSIWVK